LLEAARIINAIQKTSGTNDKKTILIRNQSNQALRDILKFIYNPYLKAGISAAKLKKVLSFSAANAVGERHHVDVNYVEVIEYLSTHTTGSDADLLMAARFINSTKLAYNSDIAYELAKAIVTQNLKIGVAVKTLNEVFGVDFIPVVGCMLGTKYSDLGPNKIEWPCIVTEKLDGIRRILVKENGVCRLFSRSGHEDTGLVDIVKEARLLPNNTVYDGELLAAGTYRDSIALRQVTNSIASLLGTKTGLIFNIFDMAPVDEFYRGISGQVALVRKVTLGAILMDNSIALLPTRQPADELIKKFGLHQELSFIKSVPILGYINELSEADEIVKGIWGRGGEGIMLNTKNGRYEVKRSKHLIKVKHTEEMNLTIVDFIEGTGKYEGMLGSLVVAYKGHKVGVGTGFTDNQRRDIWENQGKYIGRNIEFDTFGESTDKFGTVSLNCPVFKRFVGEE